MRQYRTAIFAVVVVAAALLSFKAWPAHSALTDITPTLFLYDAGELEEDQRARLAQAIIADAPTAAWPVVDVRRDQSVEELLAEALAIAAPSGAQAFSPSSASMAREIADANGLTSGWLKRGTRISLPPLLGLWGKPAAASDTSLFYRDNNGVSLLLGSGTSAVGVDFAWNRIAATGARKFSIYLPLKRARELANAGVGAIVRRERVALELLGDTECDDSWTTSPYIDQARSRLAPRIRQMAEAAARTPLVLVDYDFAAGHGSEVRRVVDNLLQDLGVAKLSAGVRTFELNPQVDARTKGFPELLVKALDDYGKYLANLKESFDNERADAAAWAVFRDDAAPAGRTVQVPPFALQAAVGTQLDAGAWVNLSWRADGVSKVMPVRLAELLSTRAALATVAAGNERAEMLLGRSPQDQASTFSQFVNVTHGSPDGLTCGSWTSPQGGRVHVLARGVSTDAAGRKIWGSSYASPLVATAAWLRHLIDGTAARDMRQRLIAASSFLPATTSRTVEARGVFDPARLLAAPGPHYLTPAGQAVPLDTMTLDAAGCGSFRRQREDGEPMHDVVVYKEDGIFRIARRTATAQFPHVEMSAACAIGGPFRFTATLRNGTRVRFTDPSAFVAAIRQVHF